MKKVLIVLLLLLIPMNTFSYEVNVHRKVANQAIALSNIEYYVANNLGTTLTTDKFRVDVFYNKTAKEWIETGSDWEDATIGASANLRFMNHFYDPATGKGLNVDGVPVGDAVSSLIWGRSHVDNLFIGNILWSRDGKNLLYITAEDPQGLLIKQLDISKMKVVQSNRYEINPQLFAMQIFTPLKFIDW
jgi:hypothetical protein